MRAEVAAACDEMFRAEKECFDRWCKLFDGQRRQDEEAVVASQDLVHQVAAELRRLCLGDPECAEAERRELMRLQVEGEVGAAAGMRRARKAGASDGIRTRWNSERYRIFLARDAITVGLGWPHRGERVTVTGARHWHNGREKRYTGPAVYLRSSDLHRTGHAVWVPAISADHHKATLGVTWEPHAHWGNADPAGDIGLRVLGAESRRLPVPLPRFPDAGDIPDAGPLLLVAPGDQMELF